MTEQDSRPKHGIVGGSGFVEQTRESLGEEETEQEDRDDD